MAEEHGSIHHIVPTSIGGKKNKQNLYFWNKGKKHKSWHILFKNFIPSLCIKIIEGWCDGNGKLNKKKMGAENWKEWHILFNNKSPEEAIEFIEKNFLSIEKKFLET